MRLRDSATNTHEVAADAVIERSPGVVVFGYDGSAASQRAIGMAARVLAPKQALVVTVWEPGVAYEALTPSIPPAPIDIRYALEVEEAMYEGAQRTAEQGAAAARQLGLDATGLAVADVLTVAQTLLRIARDRPASAIVLGTHGHSRLRELLVGTTTREVIQKAPCPVCVVPDENESTGDDRGDADDGERS